MPRAISASQSGLVATILLLAACDSAAPPEVGTPAAMVRDSAGVSIVENQVELSALPTWSLGAATTSIGSIDDPDTSLEAVQAALIHPSGEVVIGDRGARTVSVFDRTGTKLRTFLRRGNGPDEVQMIWAMWLDPQDRIHVYDIGRSRVLELDIEAGYQDAGRTPSLRTSVVEFEGYLSALDQVVVSGTDGALQGASDEGIRRGRRPFGVGPLGESATVLGTVPADERLVVTNGNSSSAFRFPWAKGPRLATGPRSIHLSDTSRPEIRTLEPDGALTRILRWVPKAPSRPLDDLVEEWTLERYQGDAADRLIRRYRDNLDMSQLSLPSHERFIVTDRDELWVETVPEPGDTTTTWIVFDPTGSLIGRFDLSRREHLLSVRDDEIVVRRLDDLDVQYVDVRPLTRQ